MHCVSYLTWRRLQPGQREHCCRHESNLHQIRKYNPITKVNNDLFFCQIEAARSGKYCKLDMRIGYIVAFPNGALQFENYADNSA